MDRNPALVEDIRDDVAIVGIGTAIEDLPK